MADRLTRIRPGPVDCPLFGRPCPVREATLGDLWALQEWVDARWPDPLAGLDDRLAGVPAGPDRDRLLFEARAAAEDGPPACDDAAGSALLYGTDAGVAFFLTVAVPAAGTLQSQLALRIASGELAGWFRSVRAAFFGADPTRRVDDLLGVPRRGPRGEPLSWGEAVDGLARSHGWTYEYIRTLTLSEFVTARRGGKPREAGIAGLSAAELGAWHARLAAAQGWDVSGARDAS